MHTLNKIPASAHKIDEATHSKDQKSVRLATSILTGQKHDADHQLVELGSWWNQFSFIKIPAKNTIRLKFLLLSMIILTGVALIGFAAYKSNQKQLDSAGSVEHTGKVISKSGYLLSVSKDIEIASLSFFNSNDTALLETPVLMKIIADQVDQLRLLIAGNPIQQQRLLLLGFYMRMQLDVLGNSMGATRQEDLLLNRHTSQHYFNLTNQIITSIQQTEENLLKRQKQINESSVVIFSRLSIVIFVMMIVFTLFLLITIGNYMHQNEEKGKRASELLIANKELALQNLEKEERAEELIIANQELAFQNKERENRAAELIMANVELAFQNKEKETRAEELIIANRELAFQNEEKEKRAKELLFTNSQLKTTTENLQKYNLGLKEMNFMTSHKVRHPVATILGFSNLLSKPATSTGELKKIMVYIKESALLLDTYTRELTDYMSTLDHNCKS